MLFRGRRESDLLVHYTGVRVLQLPESEKNLFIVIFCAVDGAINKVREIEICNKRYGLRKNSVLQLDSFIFLDRYCTDLSWVNSLGERD